MSPPPQFNDIGKSAKDLFTKGYTHGVFKLDLNAKSGPAIDFKSQVENNLTTQKIKGNLEVKYKIPDYGATITEKWNTENQLVSTLELNEQLAKGLKVTLDTNYTPHNGKRSGCVKTEWFSDTLKINTNMSLVGRPILDVSGVAKLYIDWLVGGHAKFDLFNNELKSTSIAIGHQTSNYTLHSFTDGREFGASLYHKVHMNFEYGWQLGWKMGDQGAHWGFASKYQMNPDTCLRAKVDNNAQISLAATHKLSDDVKLTLGSNFALGNFPEATTKFGVGLEYTS